MNLKELGDKYRTDKGDAAHTFAGMSYLDVYASYLDAIRDTVRSVLEIGVLGGASLRMWWEYFPKAEIFGLDINPAAAFKEDRITVHIGSQADPDVLAAINPGGTFDLIVDDGSHLVDDQLVTFHELWPRVAPGGLYVMEDMRCSYGDLTTESLTWPGRPFQPPTANFHNDRGRIDSLMAGLIADMDRLTGDVAGVHFWPMMIVILKA
jgi:predicted O-methyltransferase YrrM